jgi:hypothetical protein
LVQQLYGVDVDRYSNFILDISFEEDERFQQQAAFINIAVDPTTSSSSQDLDTVDLSSFAAVWSSHTSFVMLGQVVLVAHARLLVAPQPVDQYYFTQQQ